MDETYVALMRGINVGGRNTLPMKRLAALFTETGCTRVRTYIQSGNVVFEADPELARRLPTEIPRRIDAECGFTVPVLLRTAAELRAIVERHPFTDRAEDTKHLHVGFLADEPTGVQVDSLNPARSDVDEFRVEGSEVYLHVPGGMGRTKLTTDYFDRRLGTVMTVRNWRTVNALLEMAEGG
jgi:uncharacterized protein (DUF1697 family)